MAKPKGTRCVKFAVNQQEAVHVYSNSEGIVLQLRRDVPTELEVTATSFKVAVKLTPADALNIAGELLTAGRMMVGRCGGASLAMPPQSGGKSAI